MREIIGSDYFLYGIFAFLLALAAFDMLAHYFGWWDKW